MIYVFTVLIIVDSAHSWRRWYAWSRSDFRPGHATTLVWYIPYVHMLVIDWLLMRANRLGRWYLLSIISLERRHFGSQN